MARHLALAIALLALALSALAADPPATPLGFWLTEDGKAVVRMEDSGGRIGGRIVWLKEPRFPAGDPQAGKAKVDRENPDEAQRDRPILGLPIVFGFAPPNAQGISQGGQVYDPESGRTYSGTLSLVGKDRLNLRGYVLVSLIGRTSSWIRVDPAKYGLAPYALQSG